jgi:predicted nucleic acid-binding protein
MIYAVIDTNVFVAALLSRHPDSATVQVVNALLRNGSELLSSDILVICPFIESISITQNRVVAPERWKVVELDNEILAINTSIYKRFIRTLNTIIWNRNYPDPENLHHFDENWKEAVINVVSKEHK